MPAADRRRNGFLERKPGPTQRQDGTARYDPGLSNSGKSKFLSGQAFWTSTSKGEAFTARFSLGPVYATGWQEMP